ncbi:mfsd2ab [Symbiodinium microadriaticum]|nr:mfsd2ab [Symbiodinium microadriaticum]
MRIYTVRPATRTLVYSLYPCLRPRGPRVGAPVQLTPYPPAGLGSCLVATTRSSSVPSARKPEGVELKQAAFRPSIAAALLQRPVQEWQEEEVIRWLLEVSLAPKELAHVIREQAITGNVLLTLTEKDFEELEIPKFGHRRLLMMAATELRAVVAHTRSKEEPLRPASGPALTVALAARGPPAPRPGQASVVAGCNPGGGGVFDAPPATAKAPLVVKVFGHQRAPWGKAVAVPKVSAASIPTCRPVMRSLSGGGLSDKSSRQSTAPFSPERGSFVPSPRDAVPAENGRMASSEEANARTMAGVKAEAAAPTVQDQLSLRSKLLLGLGQGVEGIWITIGGFYLNKFFLESCCIEPVYVAIIQLCVGLFDAFNDTLIGALSDKTRTRFGRRRPWLLFGGPFMAVAYVCVWNRLPLETPQEMKMLYYLGSYMAVSLGLTSIVVQIGALVPELTSDYNERTIAAGFRVIGGNIFGVVFAVLHTGLVGPEAEPESFMLSAVICASCIWIFSWTVFCGIQERPVVEEVPVATGIITEISLALRNKAFCYVCLMYVAGPTAVTLMQSNIALFCKYILEDEAILILILPIVQGTALLMIPVWVVVGQKTSKRHVYMIGGCLLTLAMSCLNFIESTSAAVVAAAVIGVALAVPYLVPVSMLPDVVEADEEMTGRRREGVLAGLFTTSLKLSATAANVLTNFTLEQAGYMAPPSRCEAAGPAALAAPVSVIDVQPVTVRQALRWLVGPIPAALVVLATFAAWRFPITPEVHAKRQGIGWGLQSPFGGFKGVAHRCRTTE